MAWKCSTCGTELNIISTRNYSDTYTIGKDGKPKKRIWKDKSGEHIADNIFCDCCGWFDSDIFIEEVGVWEK